MRINNRDISLSLLLSKMVKVIRIKLAFILPTVFAKIELTFLECSFGKNLKACGKVYFRTNGINSIILGDNVTLTARFLTNPLGTNPILLECIKKGKIEIGNNSGVTSTIISSRTHIKIGKNVNIGGNVKILDHDFHSLEYQNRREGGGDFLHVKTERIIIDDDVFIGTNAIILKGVHVGARSIIGAGSVVTLKEIPADSVVIGNPAKILKLKLQS